VLLSAHAGIGKRNLCLAVAFSIAPAWSSRTRDARNASYIDGEMSERLMRQRILDVKEATAAPTATVIQW
jgi:hypothetical protein